MIREGYFSASGITFYWEDKCLKIDGGCSLEAQAAEELANWILETMPEKAYIITNKFRNIPSAVTFCNQMKETEIQIEEVWE